MTIRLTNARASECLRRQIVSTFGPESTDQPTNRAGSEGKSVAKREGRSLYAHVKDFLLVGFAHGGCTHHVHSDYVQHLRDTTGRTAEPPGKTSAES